MNENNSGRAGRPARGYADTTGHSHYHEVLTTEQLQALGQRRKDAEQKLERHQLEARSKENLHETDPGPCRAGGQPALTGQRPLRLCSSS